MASHYCISQCSPPTGWKRPQLWHYLGVPSKFCPRLATSQWYEGQFWALCLIMSSYDLATVTVYSHPRSRLDVNTQKCKPFWWWSDSGSPRVVQWILQAEPLHRSQASWSPSGMFDWSPKNIISSSWIHLVFWFTFCLSIMISIDASITPSCQGWADTEAGIMRACGSYCLDRFQRYRKSRQGSNIGSNLNISFAMWP